MYTHCKVLNDSPVRHHLRPGKLPDLRNSPGSRLCLKGTDTASDPVSLTWVATRVGDMGSEVVSGPFGHSRDPGNFLVFSMSERGSA